MYIKFLFFTGMFLGLIASNCLALDNYQSGFVVLEEGDTLRGLINNKQWIDNPTEVEFKKNNDDKPRSFKSYELRAFYINETKEFYLSASISFIVRKSDSNNVPGDNSKYFSGFLTVLITGELNLYALKFAGVQYFFINSLGGPITELVLKKTQTGGYLNLYRGTLKAATVSCNQLQNEVDKVSFSEKSISGYISKFNSCVSNGNSYKRTPERKFTYVAGSIIGISRSFIDYKGSPTFEPQVGSGSLKKFTPMFGGYISAILNRGQNRWSSSLELVYKHWQDQTQANYTQGVFDYSTVNSFDLDYLKLGISVRYTVPARRVKSFAQFGFSRSILLFPTITSEWLRDSDIFPATGVTVYTGTRELGGFIGTGFVYKNFETEIRYEMNSGFGTNTLVATSGNYFALMIKYQFAKF